MSVAREEVDHDREREAKLVALRQMFNDSIAEGGGYSDDEVAARIEAKMAELAKSGF